VIQLDTSFLIRSLVAGSPESNLLRGWFRRGEAIGIAAPAWAEFRCGPVSDVVVVGVARLVGEPLPFGTAEAELTATLFNSSGRRRGTLVDCMIAACAIEAGDKLATGNRADFERLEKLGLALA